MCPSVTKGWGLPGSSSSCAPAPLTPCAEEQAHLASGPGAALQALVRQCFGRWLNAYGMSHQIPAQPVGGQHGEGL